MEKTYEEFLDFAQEIEHKDTELRRKCSDSDGMIKPSMDGAFPYIPFHGERQLFDLFLGFRGFIEQSTKKCFGFVPQHFFLDVGAGSGRIVALAKFMGISAVGIELNPKLVKFGKKAYELSDNELLVKNAFDLDREFLTPFSMIYTYMPIRDEKLMGKLHMHLWENARIGAFLVEMYPRYYPMSDVEICRNFWMNHGCACVCKNRYSY